MENRMKMIKELCEVDGISGYEKLASRVFKKYTENVADSIDYDNLGSIIAKHGSEGPRIMISGHIDEVGFLVSKIEESGFIRLHPIGGWWPGVLAYQKVHVYNSKGKKFLGIIGTTSPYGSDVKNRALTLKDLYVDLGVENKKEVEDLGIKLGDVVVPVSEFVQMNNKKYWLCKAFDDRIGAAVAIEVLNNLKDVDHPNMVYACGTVQEEVGLRGAKTCVHKVKPDIAFAVDVTVSTDIPGSNPNEVRLGKGVAISYVDGSVIGHHALVNLMEEICLEKGIPFTRDVLQFGGTDSGEIHKFADGVVNCTISIPERYLHTHHGMIHEVDYTAAVDLLTEFCKRCDFELIESLKQAKR